MYIYIYFLRYKLLSVRSFSKVFYTNKFKIIKIACWYFKWSCITFCIMLIKLWNILLVKILLKSSCWYTLSKWRWVSIPKCAELLLYFSTCEKLDVPCVKESMASKQAMVDCLSYIFQFTRLHGVAVMQRLTFRDSVVTLFKSARCYVLSGIEFLVVQQLCIENVMRECKIGKSSPHQPCENLCHPNIFELSLFWWQERLHAFITDQK